MIVLLREWIEENNNIPFIESVKEQMINLYAQLSECKSISTNIFLHIIQKEFIFVKVNEYNEILGTITILLEQKIIHNGGMVAHVEDLVVDKVCRNQQIGKQLLEYAIVFARQQKCYKIILNCDETVQGFYEKCGFQNKNKEMSIYF